MIKLSISDLFTINSDIIYIVALDGICFLFLVNHKIKYVKHSMKSVELMLNDLGFIRINYHVIINTKFYVRNIEDGKKEIIMKNGTTLNVSRRKWKNFK